MTAALRSWLIGVDLFGSRVDRRIKKKYGYHGFGKIALGSFLKC